MGESYPSVEMQSVYFQPEPTGQRVSSEFIYRYLPTPPLGQDMTQGQFFSGV